MAELTGSASCCVFCLSPVETHPPANGPGGLLELEVNAMFIVQKLLSISSLECSELLQGFGNPSTWLDSCQRCFEIVKEARGTFQRICELEKNLQEKRTEMKGKILRDEGRHRARGRTGIGQATMEIRNMVMQNACLEGKLDEYIKIEVEEMDNEWIGKSEEEDSFLDDNEIVNVECKLDEVDADWRPEKMTKKSKPKKKGTSNTTGGTNKKSPTTHEEEIQSAGIKCEYCVLRFKNIKKLSCHVRHVHWVYKSLQTWRGGKIPPVLRRGKKCTKCGKRLPLDALRQHCLAEHNMLPCSKCPRLFRSRRALNVHLKRSHNLPKGITPLPSKEIISVHLEDKRPTAVSTNAKDPLEINDDITMESTTPLETNDFEDSADFGKDVDEDFKSSEVTKKPRQRTDRLRCVKPRLTIETKVNNIEVHRCHHCNYCSARKEVVRHHMLKMHKDLYSQCSSDKDSTTLQCDKCPLSEEKRYQSEKELVDHKMKVHNMLKCDKCSYMCIGLGYLENHQITYHSQQSLDPSAWFSKNKAFSSRVRTTTKLIKKPMKPPQCKFCQLMFDTRDQLVEHNLREHPEEMFKCEKCPKLFDKLALLACHNTEVHNEPNNPYRCGECDYSSKLFRQVYSHRQTIHMNKVARVVCEICSDSFAKERYLICHKAQKHGIKSDSMPALTCTQCNKTFSMPTYLQCHIRTAHLGQWRYKCPRPDCGLGFMSQKQVDHHVNSVHDKIFPFVCSVPGCQSKYAGSWQLNGHMRNKHGPKKKCSYCDYETACKSQLKCHENEVHNKSGSYQCDHCGKVYNIRKCLLQHLRMTHKISNLRKGKKATLTTFVQSVVSAAKNSDTPPEEVQSYSTTT